MSVLCEYPVTALWRLSGKFVSVTQIPRYMEVIYRSTETLKKLEDNPRTISEGQLQKLKESIQNNPDYFEARPIILSDRTGHLVIIAGNQRYDACVQLGIKEVPTVLIPNLTEELSTMYMLKLLDTNLPFLFLTTEDGIGIRKYYPFLKNCDYGSTKRK